jgi:hypothetical protein
VPGEHGQLRRQQHQRVRDPARRDPVPARHRPASRHDGARHQDIEISPDGKYLYAIGPIGRHVAVFAIGADRLPRELPAGQSPYRVVSGQWTAGLVVK